MAVGFDLIETSIRFGGLGPGLQPVGGIQIPTPGTPRSILEPGGGIGIPGTGGAGQVCPPGTACRGASAKLPFGLGEICLGSCSPIPGDPGTIFPPGTGSGGGIVAGDVLPAAGGQCDLPTRAYCQAQCGTDGAQCRTMGACQLPSGRGGNLNKSRYYQFGDCRRGTSPGVVLPGTKCVKRRRINPANAKASARAARRVTAAIKHQDRLVKAMKKTMRGR